MHKLESVLKNKTQTIPLDFAIQTDHLISARRADLVTGTKKRDPAEK